jgi:hypothetical protein
VYLSAVGQILRERRRLLAVALVIAVVIGVLVSYRVSLMPPGLHTRVHAVGQASAQVLIDTPRSQIADLNPTGPTDPSGAVIYARAGLLADLVATPPVERAIAVQAGIPFDQLVVTPPPASIVTPAKGAVLPGGRTPAAARRWKLAVTVDPSLPIIAFVAVAPSPRGAAQLAAAAISSLGDQMSATADAQRIPTNQRLIINPIAPPVPGTLSSGPGGLVGLIVGVVAFLLMSAGILGADGRLRRPGTRRPSLLDWQPGQLGGSPTIALRRTHHEPLLLPTDDGGRPRRRTASPERAAGNSEQPDIRERVAWLETERRMAVPDPRDLERD